MPKLGSLKTNKKWSESLAELQDELTRWGIRDYVLPKWETSRKSGVVSLKVSVLDQWMPIECARFPTPEQNIRAVLQVVEAVRKASQRGISLTLLQATKAWMAMLPSGEKDPCEVLGVPKGTTDKEILTAAYHRRVKETHPDLGGTASEFMAVEAAGRATGVK